jgi:conjugative transfer region protein TrbK
MDGKLLARIGAAVFVGLAVAMTLVQLREEPRERGQPGASPWVPDGDPLPAQLRTCSEMGELALSSPDCRGAWAEKRRRFFGVDHPAAYSGIATGPVPTRAGDPAGNRGED